MKIAILGGTFNPPHIGHLNAAKAVLEGLEPDKLLLVPANIPPHKPLPEGSPTASQRLEMTNLFRGGFPRKQIVDTVEVSDLELQRTGKSYTSDTLLALKEQYPDDELWLLMGTDMFLSFLTWHEPETILHCANIATFIRSEHDVAEKIESQIERLKQLSPRTKICRIPSPNMVEISSTQLRTMFENGQAEPYLVPAVYGYILREGLYGTQVDLKHLSIDQLRPIALSYLNPRRMSHVLGTEQEAIRLAKRYGAEVEKAQIAALLHDCTKKLTPDEQFFLCKQYHIELDGVEQMSPKLLHAKTGAEIARDVFGVEDDIYQAIKWHTTGHANMTLLQKVIYLADYIEPNRDFPGVESIRTACYEDLDKGLDLGLKMTIDEMTGRGIEVHHYTREARESLKGTRRI